jgi:hypothetical protein
MTHEDWDRRRQPNPNCLSVSNSRDLSQGLMLPLEDWLRGFRPDSYRGVRGRSDCRARAAGSSTAPKSPSLYGGTADGGQVGSEMT